MIELEIIINPDCQVVVLLLMPSLGWLSYFLAIMRRFMDESGA
jgi:hypothetical protein